MTSKDELEKLNKKLKSEEDEQKLNFYTEPKINLDPPRSEPNTDPEEALKQGNTVFTFQKNEKGQLVTITEKLGAGDEQQKPLSKQQEEIMRAVFSGLKKGFGVDNLSSQTSQNNEQQAQIVNKEQPKFPSPQDKGGNN